MKFQLSFLLSFSCFWLTISTSLAQTYNSVESVEYDETNNRFLASNGNSIIARSSDGTLSFFGSGSGTHGMEVMGNTLFVIDGNTIRGYDLNTEQEVMTLNMNQTGFLNGMTNDGTNIYVTDFSDKKIYKIDVSDLNNPISEVIVDNTVTTPNGIWYDATNNRLLFVNWNNSNAPVKSVDLSDNSVSTILNTPFGNIDGIDEDNDGNLYISHWSPNGISKYDPDFANAPINISVPGISNPADICYAKAIDTLAIPIGNNVLFVGFELDTIVNSLESTMLHTIPMTLSPNPIQDHSNVQFFLTTETSLTLDLLSLDGRLVKRLMEGLQLAGYHKVFLTGIDLVPGTYSLLLKTPQGKSSLLLLR